MDDNKAADIDLAEASGESAYRAPRALELNEVSLNGDADATEFNGKLIRKGGYFRKRILVGRTNRDQKPKFFRGDDFSPPLVYDIFEILIACAVCWRYSQAPPVDRFACERYQRI